jgi:hypothetical protein
VDALHSERCLKTLITYHATRFPEQVEEEFTAIEAHLQSVTARKLRLTVDSSQFQALRDSMVRLVRLKLVKDERKDRPSDEQENRT